MQNSAWARSYAVNNKVNLIAMKMNIQLFDLVNSRPAVQYEESKISTPLPLYFPSCNVQNKACILSQYQNILCFPLEYELWSI